jgi:hypothetical protein
MKIKITFLACLISLILPAQTSELLGYDSEGKLTYVADANGNKIPDFSYAGYHHSEKEIPNVPVKLTISNVEGDNLNHIQNAIDELEAMQPDSNGFRGALLLKAGNYEVNGIIKISKSGIVIRGEGKSTIIRAMQRTKSDFIVFEGASGANSINSTRKKIIDTYVPVGARTVTVENGHTFKAGDRIILERKPNQDWINMLGMNDLKVTDPDDTNWTPSSYTIKYKRKVFNVNGNAITFDAPVVDLIEPAFAEGFIYKYTWDGKIEEVGIENIQLNSYFASEEDENHAWNAVTFTNVENGWAKKVYANYFTYSCVTIGRSSMKITVDECEMRNHKGIPTGGRMYSFNVVGQQNLVKNCTTERGRHDYVTADRVAGPNVFLNCKAEKARSDTGPHHRWASGLLFDNINVEGNDINVQNRRNSGSGHGWAGVSCMLWNCIADDIVLHDPPGDHTNWAIGCKANHTNMGCCVPEEPFGHVESVNINLNPQSLFEKQLQDRLAVSNTGVLADNNFTIESIGETCLGINNGKLSINASKSNNYIATVNGATHTFSENLSLDDMNPGTYDICINVDGITFEQCYSIEVSGGTSLSGKIMREKQKASVSILSGTAPYSVFLNNELVYETYLSTFDIAVNHNDDLQIKSSEDCQGKLSKRINMFDDIKAYPNPTNGRFDIYVPQSLKALDVEVYNIQSQLIKSQTYPVISGKITLDISDKLSGIYFLNLKSESPKFVKIIKN